MICDFAISISILMFISQADGEGQRGDVVLSLEHASHASQGQAIKFTVLKYKMRIKISITHAMIFDHFGVIII